MPFKGSTPNGFLNNMNNNVLIIVYAMGHFGGGEVYACLTAKYMQKAGMNVHFLFAPGEYSDEYYKLKEYGITCYEIDIRFGFLKGIRFINSLINRNDIKFVFTHHYLSHFIIEIIKIFNRKFVHIGTIHALFNEIFTPGLYKTKLLLTTFFSYHRMDRLIAVSSNNKKIMQKYFHLKKDKIIVIHNSIDFERMVPSAREIKELDNKINPGDKFRIILNIGRLDHKKGQDDLIHSIGKYFKSQQIKVVFVGNGIYQSTLESIVKKYKIEDQIYFAGYANNIWPYYAISDMFVFPSLNEGLPGVVLEAMYFKLPVIASMIPGNMEIIQNGINGILVPIKSHEEIAKNIQWLISNPEIGKKLARNAYEDVLKNYNMKDMVDKIIDVSLKI